MTSTIDAPKNIIDGKPPLPEAKLGGPTAPYHKEKDDRLLLEAASKKEELRSRLRVGIWVVEFTKVDGTPAIMECTLDGRFLPPGDSQDTGTKAADNPTVLRVYAMDRNGWRSFKVLNVTRFYQRFSDGL